jgi:predicted DNA-binding transcriptional regulator YafY
MRADRLLSILLLLQVHRRVTARDLAKRLEVSERTVLRDMDALGGAGVPVTSERGAGGGWSLVEGYQTKLTGLSAAEIQSLFLARPPRLMADLGLHQQAGAAMIKLQASLPAASHRHADFARQRILVDSRGWRDPAESVACLPVLLDALWRERQVRFVYTRVLGEPGERIAHPLGLVAKGSTWYLVARVEAPSSSEAPRGACPAPPSREELRGPTAARGVPFSAGDSEAPRGAYPAPPSREELHGPTAARGVPFSAISPNDQLRTYRVSRMREVAILDQPASGIAGFDLPAYWERSAAEFRDKLPRYYATFLASPAVMQWVRYRDWRLEEETDAPGAPSVRIKLRFDSEEEALQFALSFGPRIEAIDPPDLRAKILDSAQKIVDRYRTPS